MKSSAFAHSIREFLSHLLRPSSLSEISAWGWTVSRRLTVLTDEIALPIVRRLPLDRVAVYAVGGYGRQELSPFSDVDLLFLTDGKVDLATTIAELWDAGLKPSITIRETHAIRSSVEQDLLIATSLLDARHLAGLRSVDLDALPEHILSIRPRFVAEHLADRAERCRKHPGAGFQEPNLREGRGGLRDLQLKRWLGLVASKAPSKLWQKAAAGLSLPPFSSQNDKDFGTLLAIRAMLHVALNRREDRLLISDRAVLGEWLKWPDADMLPRATLLSMKGAAREWEPVADAVALPGLDRGGDPAPLVGAMRKALAAADGPKGGALFRTLDADGRLGRLLPDWNRISGLVRPDAAHRYTPEEHTLRVVEAVERIPAATIQQLDLSLIPRRDLLVLAALFHDIGKGTHRDHAHVGREIAHRALERWGYPDEDIAIVDFLVAHHMILTHNAFRRDVDDPNLIHAVARRVGDIEKLSMLYCLTVADLKSVSDDLFTEWKANLLNTLTRRVARQVRFTLPPAELAARILTTRRDGVLAILTDPAFAAVIDEHFALVDARYALAHPPERIAEHIRLIPSLAQQNAVIARINHPSRSFSEVTVITRTHRGLFCELAGTLAARGFNILEADIFTRGDGVAIDTFKVDDGRQMAITDEERWQAFARDLDRVESGQVTADELISRQLPYARRPSGPRPAPTILMDNTGSRTHTLVEVIAPDELGLLYKIGSVFRDCEIGVTSAIVSTAADLAVDVFYVTTKAGEKLGDDSVIGHLRRALSPGPPSGADQKVEGVREITI